MSVLSRLLQSYVSERCPLDAAGYTTSQVGTGGYQWFFQKDGDSIWFLVIDDLDLAGVFNESSSITHQANSTPP